ncbi:Methyl-accepting chemotaxis protein 4 [Methyloligella halotolerans]|uniref:Methyl-accepting chemotaxis protein 4 n=1 Tax=Methyloligella halotolerans TaxID=1177755 RepID=A0A1E2RXI8_9HYPH|nr:methyl-accepting chemotaxis protein [Methyloligella halotolerans]ODA66956.1 Methyl-accepting chemotaxis protein 4 [Methyloligella halotolerans]
MMRETLPLEHRMDGFSMGLRLQLSLALMIAALGGAALSSAFQSFLPELSTAMLWGAIVAAALAAIAGYLMGRTYSRALRDLQRVIARFTKWDMDGELPHMGRNDEIGDLSRKLADFQDDATEWSERHQHEIDSQWEGRLSSQRRTEQLIEEFRSSIAGILGVFADSAHKMDETAHSLANLASGSNERVSAVASASNEASSNVQTVAATTEELAVSVGEIGTRVSTASKIVSEVTGNARAANEKVAGLAAAASRIGDVVNLIQDVAAQTNLLALNATIEAARAGEAGRGFAVVANEVKTLADQTAKATDDIRQQIGAIQLSTQAAVESMEGIVVSMSEVNSHTQEIASAVHQQSAATSEISHSVREAARGTEEVAGHMPNVTHAVDETSESASRVLQVSQDLNRQADVLRETVETFLRQVAQGDEPMKRAS